MQPYLPLVGKAQQAVFRACSCAWLALFFALAGSDATAKEIAGWIERIRLEPSGLDLKAKLDTGAKTSSLHATEIESYTRAGRTYLRVRVENAKGNNTVLEGLLVRHVKIKSHTGNSQVRPVILLSICLGGISKEMEVNLMDRGSFNYQMLIGRSFLKGDFLIDPARTFLLKPRCPTDRVQ